MARIRSLKPEFAKSETLARLPREVRLHFALLWTYADDEGRGVDNPRLIKAELWPLDDDVTAEVVEGWQIQLAENGRILRYEVAGRFYFEVANFSEHQHPQKRGDSKLPAYADGTPRVAVRDDYATTTETLPPVVVVGVGEGVVGEGNGMASATADATCTRPRDLLFESLAEACGIDWRNGLTPSARGSLVKAVADLRGVGATPEEISVRADRYLRTMGDAVLTPPALSKHWPRLAKEPPQGNGRTPRAVRVADRAIAAVQHERPRPPAGPPIGEIA